jgi:hypothetical protein
MAGRPWYGKLTAEVSSMTGEGFTWRPYVYYRRRGFHGTYLNIDSLEGHVTEAASATIGAELATYLTPFLLRPYRHPSPGPRD